MATVHKLIHELRQVEERADEDNWLLCGEAADTIERLLAVNAQLESAIHSWSIGEISTAALQSAVTAEP